MSDNAIARMEPPPRPPARLADAIERALIKGDLRDLDTAQRIQLVQAICERERIDWTTRPFDYFTDKKSGKVSLYARADCARQLAKRDCITLEIISREVVEGCFVVHVRATAAAQGKGTHKRTDDDLGAVYLGKLEGDDRANALLKAITKAKRRVTLSICGLGLLDETEVDSIVNEPRSNEPRPVEMRNVEPAPLPAPTAAQPPPQPSDAAICTAEQIAEVTRLKGELGMTGAAWKAKLATWGVERVKDVMTIRQAGELIRDLKHLLACRALEPQIGPDGLPIVPPPAPSPMSGGAPQAPGFRPAASQPAARAS